MIRLEWSGGLSPVVRKSVLRSCTPADVVQRVEFYQEEGEAAQSDLGSDWTTVHNGFHNVYYNVSGGPRMDWQVVSLLVSCRQLSLITVVQNVEAGRNLWVSIIDHTGQCKVC